MQYETIREAVFLGRPNRFLAHCKVDGREERCHVKNTGRCRELLLPGCTVYLEESKNPTRKTKFDLIAVRKGNKLFNIDSTAPNKVFGEYLAAGNFFSDITWFRPEMTYGSSRFDFYAEHGGKRAFIEVKGVTLEENGVLLFPDAPTERGVKHIHELCAAIEDGYEAHIVFVVQTDRALYFTPNRKTHPAFAEALSEAARRGVKISCFSCHTEPWRLSLGEAVQVIL